MNVNLGEHLRCGLCEINFTADSSTVMVEDELCHLACALAYSNDELILDPEPEDQD